MLVEEFNEFMQIGFPKGYFIETVGDDPYEGSYDDLGRIPLPNGVELSPKFVENTWLEPEDLSQVVHGLGPEEYIPLEKAVNDYFSLNRFNVGDIVAVISEDGFIPEYWDGYCKYTSCRVNKTIHSISADRKITLSLEIDGEIHHQKYEQYSATGYKIEPVFEQQKGKRKRKLLGLALNYRQYITHQTDEILAKRKEIDEAISIAKELYLSSSELFQGRSFTPENRPAIEEALKVLRPLLNDGSTKWLSFVLKGGE